ncbi:Asp-tRNA(Asn)/Glu-tRNA(Gln) amidotransferase subunit GatA [Salisediminibacterium selenitireducens]|uniref:Glutamyl-tRNA(Gln) amidotransferase subunit A n=1 Tax=Bacillus selenitireducens (strain ATCC 700615 / DSM 15326 / MLS10) TaxID=439292 RepID=D6XYW6_BACIE|nr:Asp-tRNA(Asn)/Glu-tRNA(Gln) amidotransferase subunit GatA [Salisediminibacterium selenitireducens]ADH98274.1 glutamyl-tRNA(Gln) amidotransferase, A subunit [[Bacillus] selenitireducens MLS10]
MEQSVKVLHDQLRNGETTVRTIVDGFIARIKEVDGDVGAFLRIDERAAIEKAEALDEQLEKGDLSVDEALFGLPVGIKDNIVTKGMKTTCASQLLDNFEPIHDATVVEKLAKTEAIAVGKLNMDEFAMGSSNENSSYHPVRNPWDLTRVPGGSSGGSAAAVAAGEVPYTLGSDTGGSIREPAAYCGVTGMKPTYGRVSRFGLVAFASSLDQIGPLTRNAEDNALVLQAIAGYDKRDSTSANVAVPDFSKDLNAGVKGLKVAVPKEYLGEGVDEGVKAQVTEAIEELKKQGAVCEEVSLPHSKYATAAYYLISSSEASANLARFDGIRYGVRKEGENLLDTYRQSRSEGFGDEVKRRIMLGTFALSSGYYDAYYDKAQRVRTLIKQDFEKLFETYDVIVGPTAPTVAFKIGEQVDDPLTMYANDIMTVPMNLAGVPAISIPCGFSEGMPVGLQIIGKHFDEAMLYRVAHAYQQVTDHHQMEPALKGGTSQ